jgi:hypothetical protein
MNGIQTMTKEVNNMEKNEIKEARRTPDGNCVAVDDIVEVSVGYVGGQSLYDKVGRRNTFKARIVSFESGSIVFDLSTSFRSNQVGINYSTIKAMRPLTEEEKKCL